MTMTLEELQCETLVEKHLRRVHDRPKETCCAAEAIEDVSPTELKERISAYRALCHAAGICYADLTSWNDAAERTHAEVKAAFNLAIATLRL